MELENRIIVILQNNLEGRLEIKLESRLEEDLLVDSFDRLMIISALEDEFSITINVEDFSDIVTVNDIVEKFKTGCYKRYKLL